MLPIKTRVEGPRLPFPRNPRTAANTSAASAAPVPPVAKGGKSAPLGTSIPNPGQAAAAAADAIRTAGKGAQSSGSSGAAASKTQGKSKAAGSPTAAKTAARRDAHIGHAVVGPSGRERGGSGFGGSQGHGHPDIQDWMPFSAQQSRIVRSTRAYPAMGLTKVVAHPLHPLRAAVYTLANRLYTEVLPSLFRRTPQEMERQDRMRKDGIRKDALRKEQRQRSERQDARRDAIRKLAEVHPSRVMAGDLTVAFATR
jgi:hypothetical protein